MAKRIQNPNDDKPLPDCEGPKLHPFQDRKAAIDFRRLLSGADSGSGGHAHVFEVSIRSRIYALKVFRFFDPSDDEAHLLEEEREIIPTSVICAHMDPFYNECRAYGRLVEKELNGTIAVRCYGYLTLPATIEDELHKKFDVVNWDRPDEEYESPISERQPLRAIVKELVKEDSTFTAKDLNKMLRHVKHLRRVGIYPGDVRARNYRAGLPIDFSCAMTEPHYLFQTRPEWNVSYIQSQDLLNFDSMVSDEKLSTWIRATPNREYLKRLRRPPESSKTFDW